MSKQYDLSLLAGAQGHLHDFLRSTQIGLEFFHGFRRLRNLGPTVTVFGSARFSEDHPSCVMARAVGAELARAGFTVMTGGGPGQATELLITYIYKNSFTLSQFDYAAAVTVVMFLLFLTLAMIANRMSGGDAGSVDIAD